MKITNQPTERRFSPGEDREMILHGEGQWPRWPLLPVKRWRGNDLHCGVIFAFAGKTTVFRCLLFGFNPEAPKDTYASVDELLADGWVVD